MDSHVPPNHNIDRVMASGSQQPDDLKYIKDVKEDTQVSEAVEVHMICVYDKGSNVSREECDEWLDLSKAMGERIGYTRNQLQALA